MELRLPQHRKGPDTREPDTRKPGGPHRTPPGPGVSRTPLDLDTPRGTADLPLKDDRVRPGDRNRDRHTGGPHHRDHHRKHRWYRYNPYWKYCSPSWYPVWSWCRWWWWGRPFWWSSTAYCKYVPYHTRYDDRDSWASPVTHSTSYFIADASPPLPCGATVDEAWAMLGEDRIIAAYDALDCLVEQAPDDGLTLVGFALAAGLLDQHDEAVDAMRDALRLDPASLAAAPRSDGLDAVLLGLVEQYDERARRGYADLDALFMVAALRYLLGDDPAAHYAIAVAITLGDTDASARNLEALIGQ